MADPRRSKTKRKDGTSTRRKIPVSAGAKQKELDPNGEEMTATVQDESSADEQESRQDERVLHLQERLLRLQAEFDNYRKRQARDFRKLCSQGKKELIEELLAVLDNYHRAEKLVEEGGHSVEEIANGLMKTSEQLTSILTQEGLMELEVNVDDPFDPNIHEAMLAEESEGVDRDTVLEIFQRGYRFGDELLRPARVRVGKAPVSSNDGSGPETEGGE